MTEPLARDPKPDHARESAAGRQRQELDRPVISAPQPGLLPDPEGDQASALQGAKPPPTQAKPTPAPPTRPTRQARRRTANVAHRSPNVAHRSPNVAHRSPNVARHSPPTRPTPAAPTPDAPAPDAPTSDAPAPSPAPAPAAPTSDAPAPDAGAGLADLLPPPVRLAARATAPELGQIELRQIAGLSAGVTMRLDAERYYFSEEPDGVGFQIEVDHDDRALVLPGTSPVKVDTVATSGPTLLGAGVLDVGSARFLVRHRREHKRATDWLDQYDAIDRPEPLIDVPDGLGLVAETTSSNKPPTPKGRAKKGRNKKGAKKANKGRRGPVEEPVSRRPNATSVKFIERVRATRNELSDRERYLHPDPAELALRAAHRAPILGIRPPGHPLFAKVSVMAADMPWKPHFDDLSSIPDSLGPYMKPLMSLPSLPIAADLMIGPLGIVGDRSATVACARHIMTSLYGLSTPDMHLHVAATGRHLGAWEWAVNIVGQRPTDVAEGFSVVIVDGMESFASSGLDHGDAIERRAGFVILAESVEDLPAYCGTVLQVDRSSSGLLTNHLGNIIAGTPIGITADFAASLADDLHAAMQRRRSY